MIFQCFTDGFQNGLQSEIKSPQGMINKFYAHADLAAGEAQPDGLSDEKLDISCVLQYLLRNALDFLDGVN